MGMRAAPGATCVELDEMGEESGVGAVRACRSIPLGEGLELRLLIKMRSNRVLRGG